MTGLLDKESIDLPCPHCRNKVSQTIGQLKLNPKLTCRACHKDFTVNANELRAAVNKVEKELANLQRTLGRFGK